MASGNWPRASRTTLHDRASGDRRSLQNVILFTKRSRSSVYCCLLLRLRCLLSDAGCGSMLLTALVCSHVQHCRRPTAATAPSPGGLTQSGQTFLVLRSRQRPCIREKKPLPRQRCTIAFAHQRRDPGAHALRPRRILGSRRITRKGTARREGRQRVRHQTLNSKPETRN